MTTHPVRRSVMGPLLVVLIGPALAMYLLEFGFSGDSSLLVILIMFALSALSLGMLIWGAIARQRTGLVLGVCLITAIVTYGLMITVIGGRRVEESKRRGDSIAVALAAFRVDNGRYPDALSELLPKYLPAIPNTSMALLHDIPFRYEVGDRDGFALSFPTWARIDWRLTENTPWSELD